MSLGREILEETRKLDEKYSVPATFYNAEVESPGETGQVNASFMAITDQGDVVYHKMIDWCNSVDELREYSGKALKELVDFVNTTDYYIGDASIRVMGITSIQAGTSANYKIIGSWDIYKDGEFTEELNFAKEALGYE